MIGKKTYTSMFGRIFIAAFIFSGHMHKSYAEIRSQSIDFEHFSTKDGLANPFVYDIIQDRQGFLWFATGNGISKFNGYEFVNFVPDASDPYSIGRGPIINLFLDSQQNIWATSFSTGLYKFDEKNNRFIFLGHDPQNKNSPPSDTAYVIDEDKSGNLWISTLDAGIVQYNPRRNAYTRYQHDPANPDSLSSNRTTAILCDSQGAVWVSTMKHGLDKLDPVTGKCIHYLPGTPHAVEIIEDRFHDIWIPTLGKGVFRYIRKEDRFVSYLHDQTNPNSISHNQIVKAFEDSTGTIWLTTWGGGINIYDRDKDQFKTYMYDPANPHSLNHDSTWGIYEDHSGVIWIGTYGAGINKFDRKSERFQTIRHYPGRSDGLNNSSVKTIYEDAQGILWIGTLGGGITQYNPQTNQYKYFTHDPSDSNTVCHNNVWKIIEDRQNNLWIATENGLNRYDKNTGRFYHFQNDEENPHSLASNLIRNIIIDDENQLWIGTQLHGVDRLNLNTLPDHQYIQFEHFPVPGGHNSVLFQDSKKRIWVANQRLFRFEKPENKFEQWRFKSSDKAMEPQGLFTAMTEDFYKNLWIGTSGSLYRFVPETNQLTKYGPGQGLNDSSIAGLQAYPTNELWVSTSKGLSMINLSEPEIKNYDLGIFNRGAALLGKDRNLFFGGLDGMVYFSPEKITDNPHIPNIVLTSFKKNHQECTAQGQPVLLRKVKLNHEDRLFSFEFSALDYSAPEKNRYKYRLKGFDDGWIAVGSNRRFASYTNLDAGNYQFQVTGSNNDGIWNDTGVSLDITITSPWWKSSLFYFVVFLVIIITITATIGYLIRLRYEIRQRKRAEKSLKISSEFLDKVIDSAALSTWISDEHGTAIRTNPACLDFFGAKEEEVVGKYNLFRDSVIQEQGFMPVVKGVFEKGEPASLIIDYDFKAVDHVEVENATHKIIKTVLTPVLDSNNKVSHVIVQGIDITELKQAEKEKIRVNKIIAEHEKLSLVGRVAGKMAHDFNNILGIIMGNSELALADCPEGKIKKRLELIYHQTIRGKNLTKNLVAFAKDQEPKHEFFSIDEKIDLVITLLKKDLEGIKVMRRYGHPIPDLLADSGMIEHAMVNIIQNSIHALSLTQQPEIIVHTFYQNGLVFIEIEDNGCGIPSDFFDKIYEPSSTLKGSKDKAGMYKPGIKGTGYGMANVKKYIEQHKGSIVIHSELKKGTKVTITLPIIKKELTNADIETLEREKISVRKYILIVEDEHDIADVQYNILTHNTCDHTVDIAGDGQAAMDLLERNRYDLISLDYVLPGTVNGMDVYHHLRKKDKNIPVLFISGNIEFLESIKDLKKKDLYLDHLSKPCTNIDYIKSINQLFR